MRPSTFTLLLVVILVAGSVHSSEFHFVNNLQDNVWVGVIGNSGKPALYNGGFLLKPNEQKIVPSPGDWSGKFWGRTDCNFDGNGRGHCITGDCGRGLMCAGAGGVPPATLAEITLKGWKGLDYYDVSLVHGFNLPITITPLTAKVDPNNQYKCGASACTNNINTNCPTQLRVNNPAGNTVGCKSSCDAFNTDQYCCRDSYGTPQTCQTKDWPVNSASYFKENCPAAYSYAYDDAKSTFDCKEKAYKITFG